MGNFSYTFIYTFRCVGSILFIDETGSFNSSPQVCQLASIEKYILDLIPVAGILGIVIGRYFYISTRYFHWEKTKSVACNMFPDIR